VLQREDHQHITDRTQRKEGGLFAKWLGAGRAKGWSKVGEADGGQDHHRPHRIAGQ